MQPQEKLNALFFLLLRFNSRIHGPGGKPNAHASQKSIIIKQLSQIYRLKGAMIPAIKLRFDQFDRPAIIYNYIAHNYLAILQEVQNVAYL